MLLIIIVLVLVFGGGWGYWGNRSGWGNGPSFGLPGILIVILIIWLLMGHRGF
jgi:hypothetical protein